MSKVKIFVATHKKADFPKYKIYTPIQVGAELKEKLGYINDNEGDNISSKNPNFCELTAIYWIWKNDNSDVVGLTHYRRYFFKNRRSNSLENVLEKKDIDKIFEKYNIILPKKAKLKNTVKNHYDKFHKIKDLEECGKIIERICPEYIDAYHTVLKKKKIYIYNMVITKKELFDQYCNWLFNILFELEKNLDLSDYDDYNKRVYGFLSERLFNVWIEKNKNILKIKNSVVMNSEDKKKI